MMLGIGLSLVFSILLCIHVVRSGREVYWLFIILASQPLGGIVYALVHVLPELIGSATARKLTWAAREAVDAERDCRLVRDLTEDSPTVANRMKLAAAAAALGRPEKARQLYAMTAQGIHADDPTPMLGQVRGLIELDRPSEALPLLHRLGELGEVGRAPKGGLGHGPRLSRSRPTHEADET
ncbi:MAG: hypothetical protein QE280_05245 [Caulobacter sp.]|nr:hypothetical protein [Caulobacter sp.]